MPAVTRVPSHGPGRAVLGRWAALLLLLAVALSHGLGAEGPSGHHAVGLAATAQGHETAGHDHAEPGHDAAAPCAAGHPDSDPEDGHGTHSCLAGQLGDDVAPAAPGAALAVEPPTPGSSPAAGPGGRPVPRPPPDDTPSPGRLRI
ncbi:hypothetical protein F4556_001462 [Kitasatospora gansuensis]|uniref:Uncharacterized protein n=1 Tax=Kitasatospora gansuensis TaxID=258050 RepID=A0A7W7WFM4_9ACTN|nr:hypothetical protein [Kitasatospora gansuensis]MBB4945927.1 hypothetical protein [Kitasatospora gansuensis]